MEGSGGMMPSPMYARKDSEKIAPGTAIIARVISACVNFLLNRKLVFKDKGQAGKAFLRYVILSVAIMLASACGTWLLGKTGMSSTVAKLITDTLLYFASYRFQERWVFRGDEQHG